MNDSLTFKPVLAELSKVSILYSFENCFISVNEHFFSRSTLLHITTLGFDPSTFSFIDATQLFKLSKESVSFVSKTNIIPSAFL